MLKDTRKCSEKNCNIIEDKDYLYLLNKKYYCEEHYYYLHECKKDCDCIDNE